MNNFNENEFDNFIKQNIGGIEYCPSDDFVDKVMTCCYNYEEEKALRILRIKKYSIALLPLLILCMVIFIPGLSGIIFSLLSKITITGLLKYYTYTSIITLGIFYLLISERIIRFINRQRIFI